MILSIAEDFTKPSVVFDAELLAKPESGMYLNYGVHPSINSNNLLDFLPNKGFVFADYVSGTTYGKYADTLNRADIVLSGGIIYQSLSIANAGNDPVSSPAKWLVTNIESLRIKSFALNSQNNAIAKLNLKRRLVDSQYLYNVAEVNDGANTTLLPNDYAAWVFEPKGSDYVKFTINEIAFQATTATPQSMYVINQGVLVDTLTLNPNADGRLVFEEINYVFSGKGKFIFAVDSQVVLTNGAVLDPLKYKGFVYYTAIGTGATPEGARYSYGSTNNGLGFNVTVHLDSSIYLDNNLVDFGQYLQATWELDVLTSFLHNSNNRSNSSERNQIDIKMLTAETKDDKAGGSAISKHKQEYKKAFEKVKRTFDNQLAESNKGGYTNLRSV